MTFFFLADGDFSVSVVTNGQSKGFNDQVYLTIYGDASNSGQLPLGEPDNGLFQAESTEKFEVRINSRIEWINDDHCF